jgi:hypothetical protein
LLDSSGNVRAGLGLDKNGDPGFSLIDRSDKGGLTLGRGAPTSSSQGGTEATSVLSITAYDKKGNVIGRWPQ